MSTRKEVDNMTEFIPTMFYAERFRVRFSYVNSAFQWWEIPDCI
jgi:hypothetical protein